jgi:Protein of unknown function (DUF4065)
MAAKRPRTDDEKLQELILYVSDLCGQDAHFGAIKLNKLLFYADFLSYQRTGKSITGQEYQALPQGPAPRRLKPVVARSEKAGDLAIEPRRRFNRTQLRPVARRGANLSHFTHDDLAPVAKLLSGSGT